LPYKLHRGWIAAGALALPLAWLAVDAITRPALVEAPQAHVQSKPVGHRPALNPPQAVVPTVLSMDESIEDKLRAISASGDPEQSLVAFNLISTCLELERTKQVVKGVAVHLIPTAQGNEVQFDVQMTEEQKLRSLRKFCASMTGRTRLDRYQFLQRGVEGGAAGALPAYIALGPQGDLDALKNNPADPVVEAWHALALKKMQERIAQGYPDALLFSIAGYALPG